MKTILFKILKWLDLYLLFLLSLILIVFIPLFPKIPLFDALPGYIVRVRTEDFLVGFTALVWIIQAIKKKFIWSTSYFWITVLYVGAGLTSIILGIFLLQTIPFELLHIGKSGLTFFRYLEYFSVFFFLSSSIKTKKQLNIALAIMALTLLGVVGYGFGQKYLQFPLYSTMNREFSKGTKLYLQPGAKWQSTFAGHYDLAAYLVLSLPLLFSVSLLKVGKNFLNKKQITWTLGLQGLHLLGVVTLIQTSSKTALAAYVAGVVTVLLFYLKKIPTWKTRFLLGGIAGAAGMISLAIFWMIAPVSTKTNLTALTQRVLPGNNIAVDRPVDLEGQGHEYKRVATQSAMGETIFIETKSKSDWSPNAIKYGISMGIRLDTLWPRALSGWANNPLFGSGFGTLAMLDTDAFVEADSTDNNYLRTIGETGLVGFVIFYGFVLLLIKKVFQSTNSDNLLLQALSIGFIGSSIGLLIDAVYIDVFAASKVAFSFWMLSGLMIAAQHILTKHNERQHLATITYVTQHISHHWPLYAGLCIAFFVLHVRPFAQHTLIKNFDTHTYSVEVITQARCYLELGEYSLCRNNGLAIDANRSLYAIFFTPILETFQKPTSFYFLNAVVFLYAFMMLYKLLMYKSQMQKHFIFFHLVFLTVFAKSISLHLYPLSDVSLLILLILPVVYPLLLKKVSNKSQTLSSKFIKIATIILLAAIFSHNKFVLELKTRFRNNAHTYAFEMIQRSEEYIQTFSFNNPHIITHLNPYYYDFYTEINIPLLPQAKSDLTLSEPKNTWGNFNFDNLHDQYNQLLQNGHDLFISDYLVDANNDNNENFNEIKEKFNLEYVLLGCKETCNLYSLSPFSLPVSDQPTTISEKSLYTQTLPDQYTFNIVSNHFTSTLKNHDEVYTTKAFIQKLAKLKIAEPSFAIFTGDILYKADEGQDEFFQNTFSNEVEYPLLYNPGNFGAISEKVQPVASQTFFTDSEMFILLNVDDNSEITEKQQIALYNDLLKLERLDSIKNLFIIAHNLNWQDTSNPKNVVHMLERKLAEFPNRNKFIISGYHPEDNLDVSSLTGLYASTFDEENNITYWATLTAGTEIDTYLGISINQNNQVSINQKILE